VAVISRVLLVVADGAEVDGPWVYVAALWVPVLGSALVAELWTLPRPTRRGRASRSANRIPVQTLIGDGERSL
jgi:hypothetical protein